MGEPFPEGGTETRAIGGFWFGTLGQGKAWCRFRAPPVGEGGPDRSVPSSALSSKSENKRSGTGVLERKKLVFPQAFSESCSHQFAAGLKQGCDHAASSRTLPGQECAGGS